MADCCHFSSSLVLLCSSLPVLWLSGCDKLLASGATAACWDHSDTDACSLSGDVARGVWCALCSFCEWRSCFYLKSKHVLTVYSCSFLFTWGFQRVTLSILETQATVSQDLCMGLRWEVLPVSVWMLKSFLAWQMRLAGFFFSSCFWLFPAEWLKMKDQPPAPHPFTSISSQSASWMDTDGAHITVLHLCCRVHVQIPACSQPLCHNEKAVCLYFELSRCMPCWRGGVGPWWIGCMAGRAAGACGAFSVHGFRDKGWHRTNTDLCLVKKKKKHFPSRRC